METHRYLLDTNILSHLIRNPSGPVFDRLKSILPATACTSIIVSAEICFGLCKGATEKLKIQAEKVLGVLDILPLKRPVDQYYGNLFLAAHALALNLTLVQVIPDVRKIPLPAQNLPARCELFSFSSATRGANLK